MKMFLLLLLSTYISFIVAFKEFSLARYNDTAVYANNSVIDINLVGEGFEEPQLTDGGALECHTDDTTCCRGIDNPDGPGRGEWYYPDGTVVPPPGGGTGFYRTRNHMVIRLNRVGRVTGPIGVYQCEIPGAGGGNITRYITLSSQVYCSILPVFNNGSITYTPPTKVSSTFISSRQRYTGTIATYRCFPGYKLVQGSALRACDSDGTWSGTEPFCIVDCGPLSYITNGKVATSSGTILGSVATFSCNTGYMLSHYQVVVCEAEGMWSSASPSCPPVDCGLLLDPRNGTVNTSNGTTFGSTATYTCGSGYALSGSQSRTCRADKSWSFSTPKCERIIIQLRIGRLDCVHYSSSNSLQNIESISSLLAQNVRLLCSCQFDSSHISNHQLHCFPGSAETVNFRAQLRGVGQASALEIVSHIEARITTTPHFLLNGVKLSFNSSCPLLIPSFDSEDCTNIPTVLSTQEKSLDSGFVVMILLGTLITVVLLAMQVWFYILWLQMKKQKSKPYQVEVEKIHETEVEETTMGDSVQECVVMKGTGTEYEEINELKEHCEKEEEPNSLNLEYEIADWQK